MTEESEDTEEYYTEEARKQFKESQEERDYWKDDKESIDKDQIPHFFPTFRINRKFYPVPIILVVICAGILAYLTYVEAGIDYIEGGYISEEEYGAAGGLLNGIIFTALAAVSSFTIIFLIKKLGIGILKYIFGGSFGFLGFFLTLFFGEIILYLVFVNLPETQFIYDLYNASFWVLLIGTLVFMGVMLYKYFKTESYFTKNFFVSYIGLLIGALMGVIMPLWTTLAILVGISCWDMYAVLSKRGPIKEMIDMVSEKGETEGMTEEEIQEKLESGEMEYDTSNLEIGIGDLAFYSMLTSAALLQTGSVIVMILTAIAVISGTGVTIAGLKRNKILPGLPISIFLGIGTMLLSWWILTLIPA